QLRVMAQRTALSRGLQVGFAGIAILNIGKLVTQCGHDFGQHDSGVSFDLFGPLRITLRGEVQQRVANADEVTRKIIDWEIHQFFRRTFSGALPAVKYTGAALLKRELDPIEKAVDPPLRFVNKRQTVDREVAGLPSLDLQHRPILAIQRNLFVRRPHDLRLGESLAAGDAPDRHAARRNIDRQIRSVDDRIVQIVGIDQEEDAQYGLVFGVDDLDEVDARDGGLLEQYGKPIFARHQTVTSTFKNRRTCAAKMSYTIEMFARSPAASACTSSVRISAPSQVVSA